MNVTEGFLTSCGLVLDPIKFFLTYESLKVDFELS